MIEQKIDEDDVERAENLANLLTAETVEWKFESVIMYFQWLIDVQVMRVKVLYLARRAMSMEEAIKNHGLELMMMYIGL